MMILLIRIALVVAVLLLALAIGDLARWLAGLGEYLDSGPPTVRPEPRRIGLRMVNGRAVPIVSTTAREHQR